LSCGDLASESLNHLHLGALRIPVRGERLIVEGPNHLHLGALRILVRGGRLIVDGPKFGGKILLHHEQLDHL
jgi:hypothetical protein